MNFVWRWNDYEAPLIFLTKDELYTLTVGLTNFIDDAGFAQDNLIMAASTIALIPIILVFIAGQKYFIEGLTSGSVKGLDSPSAEQAFWGDSVSNMAVLS